MDTYILSPCGRRREFMRQIDPGNVGTDVILGSDRVVRLAELLLYADGCHRLGGVTPQEKGRTGG